MYIPKKGVGELTKTLRLKRNMLQTELAEKVGKHRSYIGRIETANRENIKIHTLVDIIEKGLNGKDKN